MSCPECGGYTTTEDNHNGVLMCFDCGAMVDTNRDDDDSNNDDDSMMDSDNNDNADDFGENNQLDGLENSAKSEKSMAEEIEDSTPGFSEKNASLQSKKQKRCRRDEHESAASVSTSSNISNHIQSKTAGVVGANTTPTCHSCGGTSLVSEREHLICEDCGTFIEEVELVSYRDYTDVPGTSQSQNYKWQSTRTGHLFMKKGSQVNKNSAFGTQKIKNLGSHLNWPLYLTDQAVALYEQVYPHKMVKHTSTKLKDALCVACLYSIARENEVKVTLKTMLEAQNVNKKLMTKALKLLKVISKKPLAHQTVCSLAEHILGPCNFTTDFVKKVSKLVELCEKGFVTQGRDHNKVVISVAHLAWVSEDFVKRKSVTLNKFCSQHNIQNGRNCASVQNDVKKLFITLVNQLPWVSTSITKQGFLHYLNDLVRYSYSVISKACKHSVPGINSSDSLESSQSDSKSTDPPMPILAPPSMRTTRRSYSTESSHMCLPPHLSSADLDKEDLCENEFCEKEIASYLLTPQEVDAKEKMARTCNA